MSASVPYIGSKISLVSNSDIRYEGILYTINTQESTIALQSVHCCGTEGRKVPEIPASSEIYDFIIFRGQDIKDLTVLESTNHLSDPAIMSVNQRPPGAGPKAGDKGKGGGGADKGKGAAPSYGGYGGNCGKGSVGGGYGGGCAKGSGKASSAPAPAWGGWGSSWDKPDHSAGYSRGGGSYGGWGNDGYPKGSAKAVGKPQKGMEKGGKGVGGKGVGGKDGGKGGGKSFEKGKVMAKGKDGKGSPKGGGDKGRRDQGGSNAAPIGELLPSVNEAEKSKYATEFDYEGANEAFDKKAIPGEDVDDKLKPRSGYDKTSSFFDNISCEATDRAGDSERPKIDRNKARANDQETFGDTRRPPRPTGVRRGGKGPRGWGGR